LLQINKNFYVNKRDFFLSNAILNKNITDVPEKELCMLVTLIGWFILLVGMLLIRFPHFCQVLRQQDEALWQQLDCPSGYALVDHGKTVEVFSWLLERGFEQSASIEVQELGISAYKQAFIARILMFSGLFMMVAGVLHRIFFV
jgi:hypothetical protein